MGAGLNKKGKEGSWWEGKGVYNLDIAKWGGKPGKLLRVDPPLPPSTVRIKEPGPRTFQDQIVLSWARKPKKRRMTEYNGLQKLPPPPPPPLPSTPAPDSLNKTPHIYFPYELEENTGRSELIVLLFWQETWQEERVWGRREG